MAAADLLAAAYPNWPHSATGAVVLVPLDAPLAEPAGAGGEMGDLYGPEELSEEE